MLSVLLRPLSESMRVVLQLLSGQSHTAHLECDAAVSSLREHASEHSGIPLERVRLAGDIVIGSDVSSGAPIKDLGVKESGAFLWCSSRSAGAGFSVVGATCSQAAL